MKTKIRLLEAICNSTFSKKKSAGKKREYITNIQNDAAQTQNGLPFCPISEPETNKPQNLNPATAAYFPPSRRTPHKKPSQNEFK